MKQRISHWKTPFKMKKKKNQNRAFGQSVMVRTIMECRDRQKQFWLIIDFDAFN